MQESCQRPGEVGERRERVREVGGSRPNESRGMHMCPERIRTVGMYRNHWNTLEGEGWMG